MMSVIPPLSGDEETPGKTANEVSDPLCGPARVGRRIARYLAPARPGLERCIGILHTRKRLTFEKGCTACKQTNAPPGARLCVCRQPGFVCRPKAWPPLGRTVVVVLPRPC